MSSASAMPWKLCRSWMAEKVQLRSTTRRTAVVRAGMESGATPSSEGR